MQILVPLYVTVSPIGQSSSPTNQINNGADFGPDTPGTNTMGLQEALTAIAGGGMVFVRKGNYSNVHAALSNTGNNQVVYFEPGCTLTFTNSAAVSNPTYSGLLNAGIFLAQNSAFNASYNDCSWLGNGCQLNMNDIDTVALFAGVPPASTAAPPIFLNVEGFEIYNIAGQRPVFVACMNGFGFKPTYSQCIRQARFSKIWYHGFSSTTPTGTTGFTVAGSARAVQADEIFGDCSSMPTVNYSNLHIHCAQGDTTDIKIMNSIFLCNGAGQPTGTGQVFELQGTASNTSGTTTVTSNIMIENTEFYSPTTGNVGAGQGGGYVDDTNGGSNAYVTNLLFRNCIFTRVGVGYQTWTQTPNVFGYVRFEGGFPASTSGSLLNRSPGNSTTAPTFPSGGTFTNNYGFSILATLSGGSLTAISINGAATGATSGTFVLKAGDTLTVTPTGAAPTFTVTSIGPG